MNKHTPGPWEVEEGWRGPIGGPQDTPYITVLSKDKKHDGVVIADCPHYQGNNGKANARLIAAAPEMLDFIIQYLYSEHGICASHHAAAPYTPEELKTMAQDLIQKAEVANNNE